MDDPQAARAGSRPSEPADSPELRPKSNKSAKPKNKAGRKSKQEGAAVSDDVARSSSSDMGKAERTPRPCLSLAKIQDFSAIVEINFDPKENSKFFNGNAPAHHDEDAWKAGCQQGDVAPRVMLKQVQMKCNGVLQRQKLLEGGHAVCVDDLEQGKEYLLEARVRSGILDWSAWSPPLMLMPVRANSANRGGTMTWAEQVRYKRPAAAERVDAMEGTDANVQAAAARFCDASTGTGPGPADAGAARAAGAAEAAGAAGALAEAAAAAATAATTTDAAAASTEVFACSSAPNLCIICGEKIKEKEHADNEAQTSLSFNPLAIITFLTHSAKKHTSPSQDGFLEEVPSEFVCPITMEIMNDPVIATDGHAYEKEAIESWFEQSDRSPKTNEELHSKHLVRSHTLRSIINDYMDAHPYAEPVVLL
mmetsp:Transcript_63936/g.133266  ORF Transcript_63936/g.133266 Transcript_63936/m.133266 type:complete len:422 (+) Transcript_63936:266-1531(+)